ncbi:MAG: hypothetical protein GXP29_01190 [Planctomycetes bacterium]|nr:hypothetical protein [Planctomycetota bacterium]
MAEKRTGKAGGGKGTTAKSRAEKPKTAATDKRLELERLEQFIESSRRSALAPRVFYLGIVFSSAIAFFAYWNALPDSWMNTRIAAYRNALPWVGTNGFGEEHARKGTIESFMAAKDLMKRSGFKDQEQLKDNFTNTVSSLESAMTEHIRTIRIDVLGVSFDVNDLGLFAGFVLFAMLTAFLFGLHREMENILITYYDVAWRVDKKTTPEEGVLRYWRAYLTIAAEREEECVHRRYCLRRLATAMVIIIPPVRGPVNICLRHGPKIGLMLPFAAQLLITANDFSTIGVGFGFSTTRTLTVSVLSFLWLIGIGIITILCVHVMRKIEVFFITEAKRVGIFAWQLNAEKDGRE